VDGEIATGELPHRAAVDETDGAGAAGEYVSVASHCEMREREISLEAQDSPRIASTPDVWRVRCMAVASVGHA